TLRPSISVRGGAFHPPPHVARRHRAKVGVCADSVGAAGPRGGRAPRVRISRPRPAPRSREPTRVRPIADAVYCRSCGAPILWRTMPGGKAMPIDAEPIAGGTIALHSDGVRAAVLTPIEITIVQHLLGGPGPELYKSHFATCPNATHHRK